MVDLNQYTQDIKGFIDSSINKFRTEHQVPNSIGIYCCPWAGWLTTNFNINKSLLESDNNCPDFEFVEFDFFDLSEWQNEYEKDNPAFKLNNETTYLNRDLGDEQLNQLIYNYLKPIVLELKENLNSRVILQMLDSNIAVEL